MRFSVNSRNYGLILVINFESSKILVMGWISRIFRQLNSEIFFDFLKSSRLTSRTPRIVICSLLLIYCQYCSIRGILDVSWMDLRKSKKISLSKLVSYVFKSEADLRVSLIFRGRILKIGLSRCQKK